ncbi:MAG: hypothetical protein KC731_16475, partial [Myxococcales bacterium]|nr:hypothetical protein [Myxococcales bacterium]
AAGETGALEPAPAPAPEVVPTAVASASAPIAPGLQIAADRPIRTLTLGSESVALGPGVTKTEWRVESDARELEAVAQDGAVVRVVLAPDQREVELKFPAAPRRMPVVRPLPKPSPQDNGPGIVPVFEDDG